MIALAVAACGGGSSSRPEGQAATTAVAFAQCMRTHGEPGWPDPTSHGTFNTGQIDIDSPVYVSALNACLGLLPGGFARIHMSGAQVREQVDKLLRFAACMRAHGIPNFPDPRVDKGRVGITGAGGLTPGSPLLQSASKACGVG
jgi:hypothetical protein